MLFNDMKYVKSNCEKYTLKFNDGWDYAIFTIDDTGMFNCQSTFGNYGYYWSSFGKNFKEFLCKLRADYLLTKLCQRTYFNTQDYIEKCSDIILKMRRDKELNKEQAREAWNFFNQELDSCGDSIDLVCDKISESKLLDDITGSDVWYSDFSPELDYSHSDKEFVKNIYPMFINILKEELASTAIL